MRAKILADCVALAVDSWPLPAITNEAATCTWVGNFSQGITHIVYDAVMSDPVVITPKLQAAITPFTDEEIAAAYQSCCDNGRLTVGKIGDGHILAWLQSLPWSTIIQTIISIITIIPKTPVVPAV